MRMSVFLLFFSFFLSFFLLILISFRLSFGIHFSLFSSLFKFSPLPFLFMLINFVRSKFDLTFRCLWNKIHFWLVPLVPSLALCSLSLFIHFPPLYPYFFLLFLMRQRQVSFSDYHCNPIRYPKHCQHGQPRSGWNQLRGLDLVTDAG